jgi:hypothetical protein
MRKARSLDTKQVAVEEHVVLHVSNPPRGPLYFVICFSDLSSTFRQAVSQRNSLNSQLRSIVSERIQFRVIATNGSANAECAYQS